MKATAEASRPPPSRNSVKRLRAWPKSASGAVLPLASLGHMGTSVGRFGEVKLGGEPSTHFENGHEAKCSLAQEETSTSTGMKRGSSFTVARSDWLTKQFFSAFSSSLLARSTSAAATPTTGASLISVKRYPSCGTFA